MANNPNINSLEAVIAALPTAEKAVFQRIYAVDSSVGRMRIPTALDGWLKERFGSVAAASDQRIVRVTNLVTQEEALFNSLRRLRPNDFGDKESLEGYLRKAAKADTFASPRDNTPEDEFGRVSGEYCVTASNISKYDGLHGVIIFSDFHPLLFTREQVIDYISTAQEWARRAHQAEPETKYLFLIWNCLWRAGASIFHGHAQVMLARKRHYGRVERLRQTALAYRKTYHASYFADLFKAHRAVGCGVEVYGVKVMAHLSPFKDNEIILMSDELDTSFKSRLYEILACLRDKLGVVSFNLALAAPPLEPAAENWGGFPVIAWVVDRGNPSSLTADVGGMEIYGSSVVSSDPFELMRQLEKNLGEGI